MDKDPITEPIQPLPDAESLPADEAAPLGSEPNQNPPILGLFIGVVFLTISIAGGVSLLSSLVPAITLEAPAAQAAAAVAAREDYFKTLMLEAKSVFVYDAKDDAELFSKNASLQLPLASITKVALVLAVSEVLPLESTVVISREAVSRGGGGLTWGEEWEVRDLIEYTLITSSNTGAEALAEAAGPLLAAKYPESTQSNATVWRMNSLAQQLGMQETYFLNATGLDESPTQAGAQSSARDIAKLFAHALKTNRALLEGTARTDVPLSPLNFPERYAHNTNNALSDIQGLIMGKTGTTNLAGGNLAIAFEAQESHPIILVILGSSSAGRYDDVRKLVEAVQKTVVEPD